MVEQNKVGDLRVWWVSNPPQKGERYPVKDVHNAITKLGELARRDLALGNKVYANAGGLEELNEDGEWYEYYDDEGRDINQIEQELGEEKWRI